MWKSVSLCASLFGSAALGLAIAARWIEPAALPATAAIGLCLVGVVLILAAPGPERLPEEVVRPLPAPALSAALSRSQPRLTALADETPRVTALPSITGQQPAI